ncbi:MAG: protease HtpX [Gammaproteobacteria bacterium]|nr:protease HtpX [Gammaproteobacteria bacterium]
MKAIFLLISTNIAVMAMIGVVVKLLGLEPVLQENGLNLTSLFIISAVMGFAGSFISLFMSKTMAKRGMGVHVIETPQDATEQWIYSTVEKMSAELGIKMPEVGIFHNDAPNAFATGASKNSSLVAVSTGLLQVMSRDEVEAVIGHEMAHVNNGDMITSTLLQGVLNTFVYFFARIAAQIMSSNRDGQSSAGSYFMISMVMQMVLGVFASMIVMWFSRYREFHADAGGAALTSNKSMANALRALKRIQDGGHSMALPDQMAAFGITAFGGLFSTHPPLEKRIAALEANDSVIR